MSKPVIYWFRQDLRLADLPALHAAADSGRPVIACYVLDDVSPGEWAPGGASRWWLHHSLAALAEQIRALGGHLVLRRGAAQVELPALARDTGAESVFCSRQYEPWALQQEEAVASLLAVQGASLQVAEGALLYSPAALRNSTGQPFRVFTPFWRRARSLPLPALPLPVPEGLQLAAHAADSLPLAALELTPARPDWAAGWERRWQPGSAGAGGALSRFLREALADYDESRNHPARNATSRLSPHLHYGEISPRQVWHATATHARDAGTDPAQLDKFLAELGWREFSHYLLLHAPAMPEQPMQARFRHFPWAGDPAHLAAWQRGQTGYPIVDAGMRELWQTGYMHNRVRMIAASFLTKHLLLPWQQGEAWFWDTLLDADLASNSCGWQWVAGCGADAAPYFRIFNPTLQGRKFDPDGAYVRRWVPELAALPDRFLHEPAAAPAALLEDCGVVLGQTYPAPLVDHRQARQAALEAFASTGVGTSAA